MSYQSQATVFALFFQMQFFDILFPYYSDL